MPLNRIFIHGSGTVRIEGEQIVCSPAMVFNQWGDKLTIRSTNVKRTLYEMITDSKPITHYPINFRIASILTRGSVWVELCNANMDDNVNLTSEINTKINGGQHQIKNLDVMGDGIIENIKVYNHLILWLFYVGPKKIQVSYDCDIEVYPPTRLRYRVLQIEITRDPTPVGIIPKEDYRQEGPIFDHSFAIHTTVNTVGNIQMPETVVNHPETVASHSETVVNHPETVISHPETIVNQPTESELCQICLSRPRIIAFQCGHRTCENCSARIHNCHICRTQIYQRIRIY